MPFYTEVTGSFFRVIELHVVRSVHRLVYSSIPAFYSVSVTFSDPGNTLYITVYKSL